MFRITISETSYFGGAENTGPFDSTGPIKIICSPEINYSDYSGDSASISIEAPPHNLTLCSGDAQITIEEINR